MREALTIIYCFVGWVVGAQPTPPGTVAAAAKTSVHDPVMIQQGKTFYLFSTGTGISVHSSTDLENWTKLKPVFERPPGWALQTVPGYKGHTWAPDISYHKNRYYLYYSVSAFGKKTSCIGLAANKTLDPTAPEYKWEDHGKVIQSVPGRDMWNAIDPNLVVDENNTAWLTFGSFWNGLKLVRLDTTFGAIQEPQEWYTVASRPRRAAFADSAGGNAAIEAPFIFRKNDYYYLFVSRDYCCRGEKSNYKVVVGRCKKIIGPYIDKAGLPMNKDGGSLLVQGDGQQWFGVGHNAVYNFNGQDFFVCHGYDAKDKGRSRLIIRKLAWDNDGWPMVAL